MDLHSDLQGKGYWKGRINWYKMIKNGSKMELDLHSDLQEKWGQKGGINWYKTVINR